MEAALGRKPYRSDLMDEQWKIIEPLLPQPFSVGRPRTVDLREIVNAILYLLTSGCAWNALPHDFPAEGTVRHYFHQSRSSRPAVLLRTSLRSARSSTAEKRKHYPLPNPYSHNPWYKKWGTLAGLQGLTWGKNAPPLIFFFLYFFPCQMSDMLSV